MTSVANLTGIDHELLRHVGGQHESPRPQLDESDLTDRDYERLTDELWTSIGGDVTASFGNCSDAQIGAMLRKEWMNLVGARLAEME